MANSVDLLGESPRSDPLPRQARRETGRNRPQYTRESSDSRRMAEDPFQTRILRDTETRLAKYFENRDYGNIEWLGLPEFPTQLEIASINQQGEFTPQTIDLEESKLNEAYSSTEEYLETQYRLMREDTVSTLRDAVEDMAGSPYQTESQSLKKARIYNRVYITGLTLAHEGLAHHLEFHTDRVERKIAWSQSKRLKAGTLVAVSPAEPRDQVFSNRCMVGIVAARPLTELESDQPAVDVYFAEPSMMDLDPQMEYIMVEASNGYYEAVRHTLLALQHIYREKFPMAEYLVKCQREVDTPSPLKDDPYVNIAPALVGHTKLSVDILEGWPKARHINQSNIAGPAEASNSSANPVTALDQSQFEALRRILTKRLAIIQGPPGTGKTHISIVAIRVLLENRQHGDPPIILAAQTNHALDQLLRHIAPYASDFIRLGGQTQDEEVILPRTLYRVKMARKNEHLHLQKARTAAYKALLSLAKRMRELLVPLTSDAPIHPETFHKEGLITQEQCMSLLEAKTDWVGNEEEGAESPIGRWTNGEIRFFTKAAPERDIQDVPVIDDDEDLYQKKDMELEAGVVDDDEDTLFGEKIMLSPGFCGPYNENDKKIESLLRKLDDMNNIPTGRRTAVYNYLQRRLKVKLLPRFRELAAQVKRASFKLKVARMQLNAAYIREAPIIGLTTTGLSKYRGMISSLSPKTVLIEEAAETQEAYVTAACFETLEQLVLVGDHLQLQAHCQNQELEGWNLHISLFERLVSYQGVEYQQLTTQRRMLPEMREVMNVIYPNLTDHPCVKNRAGVPGMNGINSWFMSHKTTESADEQFSWVNEEEAELVVGFYHYLTRNGTPSRDITILTFYKGQQRSIRRKLSATSRPGARAQVSTVDAYQGEENEIVILSLVRNNERGSIGFLSVINRVCVAMSRARRGFYIFGNANLLVDSNSDWKKMLKLMLKNGRCAMSLPITCARHQRTTRVGNSVDWQTCDGGCKEMCRQRLKCRHICPFHCHPEEHDSLPCVQDCSVKLSCGHSCPKKCCEICACDECAEKAKRFRQKQSELKVDQTLSMPKFSTRTDGKDETVATRAGLKENDEARLSNDMAGESSQGHKLNSFQASRSASRIRSQTDSSSSESDTASIPSLPPTPTRVRFPSLGQAQDPMSSLGENAKSHAANEQRKKPSQQDKKAGIQAYRKYAESGAGMAEPQRANCFPTSVNDRTQQKERLTFGKTGPTFGGELPMQLASRLVENISYRTNDGHQPSDAELFRQSSFDFLHGSHGTQSARSRFPPLPPTDALKDTLLGGLVATQDPPVGALTSGQAISGTMQQIGANPPHALVDIDQPTDGDGDGDVDGMEQGYETCARATPDMQAWQDTGAKPMNTQDRQQSLLDLSPGPPRRKFVHKWSSMACDS